MDSSENENIVVSIESFCNRIWDFIIVGTGMGGATLGLSLAKKGLSVLFIEKGLLPSNPTGLRGQFAELFAFEENSLKRAGRFSEIIFDHSNQKKIRKLYPFLGSGVGGSSSLFGMVMERYEEMDFETWPISYQDLAPYYDQAEELYRVKLAKPRHPDLNLLKFFLIDAGLNPRFLPLAFDDVPGCKECQGYLCDKQCKNDCSKVCIELAVKFQNARLLPECEIEKIEIIDKNAKFVLGTFRGQPVRFQAKNVALAAGALKTPLILGKSEVPNLSGHLGRNLMRHYSDLYALKIDSDPTNFHVKTLAFNEFFPDGRRLGIVQSFGRLPPVEVLLNQIKTNMNADGKMIGKIFFPLLMPILRKFLEVVTSRRLVMASIIEDSPCFENRVWCEDGRICISYKISSAEKAKIQMMRKKLKSLYKPLNPLIIKAAEKNGMLAHVCGTCKMGPDPETSVVDLENRIHGVKNLYVVDSSFFPTSGSANPALTIAANALRVADILGKIHA